MYSANDTKLGFALASYYHFQQKCLDTKQLDLGGTRKTPEELLDIKKASFLYGLSPGSAIRLNNLLREKNTLR